MISGETLRQIEKTREANFRLLHLFSLYINERADFITPEMVDEVAKIGSYGSEEAFLTLFSEACGVHPTDDGDDSAFFREFLAPSVCRLDPEKYRADPYYKNIRFPNVTDGSWELRNDLYKPYQTFIWDDVRPDDELRELPPLGYFKEEFSYPVVLENSREWMLVTPNEVETIRPAVRAARGRVVTFGLGLGYFPYMASEKDTVERVVIVEKDPAVIRLFRQYILPQFRHAEKIEVIDDDAFEYLDKAMPRDRFDYAYADIWHDAGDGVPFYLRFNKYEERFPGTRFDYWIEETMLSYLRWYDFGHMGPDVRDPYRWLNNKNTKQRAKALAPEAWCAYLNEKEML
ncbi:MAG: hypothetical protein IJI07_00125 [Flexilinea sp.]|nr:hypothetical protein [Flexilinea sp.]